MPKPKVTFQILREIAETASGMRGDDLYFVIRDGDPVICPSRTPVQEDDDTVVIHCDPTPKDPTSTVRFASIGVEEDKCVNLMSVTVPEEGFHPGGTFAADAVFWSVSAVEKFLVPYYASVYGDRGPEMAKAVLGVLLPESAEGGEGRIEGETPFAVAHLPSSEFVGEPEADPIFVSRLAALYPGGHVRRVRHSHRAQGR
ncbi:hypothetical protein [Longimicrobium sp.]|uniref:hypothetical protein n=1 Tax=Longimicrobium sp. TaxID=2029185 RepID=UPI002F95BB9C